MERKEEDRGNTISVVDFLPAYPLIERKDDLFPQPFEEAISSLKEFSQLSDDQPPIIFQKGTVGLKPHQSIISRYASHRTPYDRLFIFHAMGVGKCLARDTPVMMSTGDIKPVQDLNPGDLIMGDDGLEKEILSCCYGREEMFKITQYPCGESYTVNRSHILSLITENEKKVDIDLVDYLLLPEDQRSTLYGYQVGIDYSLAHGSRDYRLQTLLSYQPERHEHGYLLNRSDDETLHLIRSLGYECYRKEGRIFFSHRPARTRLTITSIGVGDYYGFTITGNRRFLLGDFTVTHNTISAVNAIEQTISDPTSSIRRAVIFVKSTSAEPNFYKTILKLTGTKYYPQGYSDEDIEEAFSAEGQKKGPGGERSKYAKFWTAFKKNIRRFYTFHHFREFANKIDPTVPLEEEQEKKKKRKKKKKEGIVFKKAPRIKEPLSDKTIDDDYSNAFIVVDEAHHLHVEGDDEVGSKTYNSFHKVFHKVNNSIILLMSGTPMTNRPGEIAELMNLLLPLDNQMPTHKDFDKKFMIGDDVDSKAISPYMKGMVSCLRSIPSSAPTLFVGDSKVTRQGLEPLSTTQAGYIVQKLVMSDFQSYGYLKVEGSDRFQMKTKSASNFIFPDGSSDKEGFDKYMKSKKDKESKSLATALGARGKGFSDASKPIPSMTPEFLRALDAKTDEDRLEKVAKLSIKYAYTIKSLLGQGCTYIYNNRVTGGGCFVLARILELFGYQRTNGYLNLETAAKRPRYAILTEKSVDNGGVMLSQLQETFNDNRNALGEYIQVIIGSDISSEGISFFHCEHIFVQTPHFHFSKVDQAIARGLRLGSHDFVSNLYRERGQEFKVKVHLLTAIPQEGDIELPQKSVDLYFYRQSIEKDINIKRIERAMREISFDCLLHRKVNTRGIPFTRDCDFLDCNYKCAAPMYTGTPKTLNYNLFYADKEKITIRQEVSLLFRKGFKFTLGQIQSLTRTNLFILVATLKEMIDSHYPLINKYGFTSYLREYNNIYFIIDSLDQTAVDDSMSYYTMYPSINLKDNMEILVREMMTVYHLAIADKIYQISQTEENPDPLFKDLFKRLPDYIIVKLIEGSIVRKYAIGGYGEDRFAPVYDWIVNEYKTRIHENVAGYPYVVSYGDTGYKCVDEKGNWADCSSNTKIGETIRGRFIEVYEEKKKTFPYFGAVSTTNGKFFILASDYLEKTSALAGNRQSHGGVCGTGKYTKSTLLYIAWKMDIDFPNTPMPREIDENQLRHQIKVNYESIDQPNEIFEEGYNFNEITGEELYKLWRIAQQRLKVIPLCELIKKRMIELNALIQTDATEARRIRK